MAKLGGRGGTIYYEILIAEYTVGARRGGGTLGQGQEGV